jgi:small neutral amino acid transporter SnatA (MarC family)
MTPSEYIILILFILLGLFSIIAAIGNMDWYFQTEGARFFVRYFGRTGARVFYVLLGLALIACGVAGFIYW